VIARFFAVETPMPAAKPELKRLAATLTPALRSGDFAQAMMDLGATICTSRSPSCTLCPLQSDCTGRDYPARFPVRAAKVPKPHRTGIAWWSVRDDQVLLIRRPAKGLLGGMMALPSEGWENSASACTGPRDGDGAFAKVTHVFTHFTLDLHIVAAPPPVTETEGEWWPIDRLGEAGLPSLFMKAVLAALKGGKTR
jgi:A/G-specific adenine glycosylase